MILLEILGILLSLTAVCASSNLRNDHEAESTHALSSLKQLGGQEANLNNFNIKKNYQNWLLDGVNRLQPLDYNGDVKKNLNENQHFNNRQIEDRSELNSHVIAGSVQNPSYANAESYNVYEPINNKPVFQSDIPFQNQFKQGQIEKLHEIENKGPLRNQETVNIITKEASNIRKINPYGNEFNNIGSPKTHQLFPSINNQNEQVASIQTQPNYGNPDILDNPFIQNILNKHKPKRGYLVIYPNGTVEHMNNIEDLVQKYPNHVIVNVKRNEKILENTIPTNYDQIRKSFTNSEKTDYTPKIEDHTIVPETLTTILTVYSNNKIHTEQQKITTEPTIITTSSTTESVEKYEPQTTESIYRLDTKNNDGKQPTPVPTINESTIRIKSDKESGSLDKKQTRKSSPLIRKESNENKIKEKINIEKNSTISSSENKELNKSDESSITHNTTIEKTTIENDTNNPDSVSNKLNDTNTEITSQSDKDESDSFEEPTIDLDEDRSTTQTIESSESTEVTSESEPMQCKEEDIESNLNSIAEDQVPDKIYLLHAPMAMVKLLDTDGNPHNCVQIGEPTTPLSYIICSVVT